MTWHTSPFMGLPLELRQMVYRYLLKLPKPAGNFEDYFMPDPHSLQKLFEGRVDDNGFKIHTPILRVSKAIHLEASRILYGENSFCFSERPVEPYFSTLALSSSDRIVYPCNMLQLESFLEIIGPRNVSLMKKLCIELFTTIFIECPPKGHEVKIDYSKLLEKSFRMLASSNNLRTLELCLDTQLGSAEAFERLVEDVMYNERLAKSLWRLRVKELHVETDAKAKPKDWVDQLREGIQERTPIKSTQRVWLKS